MGVTDGGTTSPVLLNRLVDWNDDAAWAEFVERYRPLIQVWCRRMRLDDDTTEELCQRIWINLAHRMTTFQYDPSKRFRGWLRRLCHSRAVDLLRERRADPVQALPDGLPQLSRHAVEPSDAGADEEVASRRPALLQLGTQVHDSVKSQVEPQTWDAFWSIAIDGLTVRQTAEALNMSYAAAFAAHKRVILRLRAEGHRVLSERTSSGFTVDAPDRV
ncbi:MAG TPA: sigma-70 family RNA polymerase sigma factor [Planctomycetaceae bacterium]|nr:sigma-70 family RNA polymerase sigma factor [Planctomycetaceae bacterium]